MLTTKGLTKVTQRSMQFPLIFEQQPAENTEYPTLDSQPSYPGDGWCTPVGREEYNIRYLCVVMLYAVLGDGSKG